MSQNAIRILLCLSLLMPGVLSMAPAAHAEDGIRLTIGRISNEPRKHFARLTAMADYLAAELAGDGVAGIDVIIVSDLSEMEAHLASGQVDLLSETPFMALDMAEKGLVDILLREWKKGVPDYYTVFIARKDGSVRRLEDLVGRRFAFEDPGSTSGYLMPRAMMENAGLSLQELAGPRDDVPAGKVGYSFAQGEINITAWVSRGMVDAGAINNLDWDDPSSTPAHFKDDLMIFHRTPPVIRSTMLVRKGLDEKLKTRIATILESMHETETGRAVLKTYFKVTKYDRIEGPAMIGLENARKFRRQINMQTH